MYKHRGRAAALAGAVVLAAAAAVASCSNSSEAPLPGSSCSINSDCDNPLICAFAKCHTECKDSARDCPTGQRCVSDGTVGVCQLPAEATCSASKSCASTALVCTSDMTCRTKCTPSSSSQCFTDQTCVAVEGGSSGACYDNSELNDSGLPEGDGSSSSGEGGNGEGGAAGEGGSSSGDGGGGGGGDSTVDTGTGNSCPSAQTQFGFLAQGDANPSFTSGVGVRTANQLLIFSAYVGPSASDEAGVDGGPVNQVWVQAFDPTTSMKLGPAAPLFDMPAGMTLIIDDVSIAPSGQIALAFNYGGWQGAGGGNGTGVSIAFLAPGGDAGASGLQLATILPVATGSTYQQVHVVWSVASQAFEVSWEYSAAGVGWVLALNTYAPTGHVTGGTNPVPTNVPQAIVNAGGYMQGSVGNSGNLVAVAFEQSGPNYPWLSFLNLQGLAVGVPLNFYGAPGAGSGWVTVAGTSQGFVALYDNGNVGTSESFIAMSGDAGVTTPADGGDAGLPGFNFTGAIHAVDGRAINDDTGGAGGVGAVVLYQDGARFVYVNADGITHVGPTSVIPQTHVSGDLATVTNFRGSFGISLYSAANHSTQFASSGCSP
jgi:hypothetical protein